MIQPSAKLHTPLLLNICMLLVLITLVIQDLVYKTRYIGPDESFSFRTATYGVLRETPMVAVKSAHDSNANALSSWPHLLSSCDNITAFDSGGGFVVIALGTNCTLGQGSARLTAPNVIMTSDVRLDSIVWTCCKLLFPSQQPSICQDHIVTEFLNRYMLPDITVSISDLAQEGSDAEKELVVFLDMVSRSYPLHKMVCVEGFLWPNQTLGYYLTTIYGCASPNLFRSDFIGISNPRVRDMLRTRVWLSADTFESLGLRFGIRQNSKSTYTVEKMEDGKVLATAHVNTNFSCFGPLYAVMILMDVILLCIYLRAGYASIKWVFGPHYKAIMNKQRRSSRSQVSIVSVQSKRLASDTNQSSVSTANTTKRSSKTQRTSSGLAAAFLHNDISVDPNEYDFDGVVNCSLYKSRVVVLLVIASQMLSWTTVLPNIILWHWSLLVSAQIRAYLSSLRVTVLVMVSCNLVWDGVTKINEEFAYFVSSRTFISPFEIMIIGIGVAKWKLAKILVICDKKWELEHQRVNDYLSFPGYVAHGIMYEGAMDFRHSTPSDVFLIVYQPLLEIIFFSLLVIAIYVAVKGVALYCYCNRKQIRPYDAHDSGLHGLEHGEYHRLPIEVLLDHPIRAKCLVRNSLSMEIMINRQRWLRPSCYLDYGILPRDGNKGAQGFFASERMAPVSESCAARSSAGPSLKK